MHNAADTPKERDQDGSAGADPELLGSPDWVDTIGLGDERRPPAPGDWVDTIPMSLPPQRPRR